MELAERTRREGRRGASFGTTSGDGGPPRHSVCVCVCVCVWVTCRRALQGTHATRCDNTTADCSVVAGRPSGVQRVRAIELETYTVCRNQRDTHSPSSITFVIERRWATTRLCVSQLLHAVKTCARLIVDTCRLGSVTGAEKKVTKYVCWFIGTSIIAQCKLNFTF